MRNLKRALSLALASVMLLGMMVVGTSAASYTDVDEKDNVEAIEVLNAVNVMIGRQGNFEPDEPVNRHEMAVIMAKLVLGVETADNYVGSHPFTDVVPWADKYVAACYENGLVSGTSATTYGGSNPLTAVQAAAMMLRALGYEDLSKGATDWRAPVTAAANRIRLFDGVASNPSEKLNRNQVAQLALNTLKSPVVDTKQGLNITGSNGDYTFTVNGDREYIARSSREAFAKAINSTESQGTSASSIGGYTIELGEHLYNGDLKLYDDRTDVFGRPSRRWEYNGKEIGTYAKDELLRAEYTSEVTGRELYDLLGSSVVRDSAINVTIDGVSDSAIDGRLFNETAINRNNRAGVGGTGNGVLTQVYVDPNKGADGTVDIAIINTYLARAAKDYDAKKETLDLDVYGLDKKSGGDLVKTITAASDVETLKVSSEDFAVADVKEKDTFLVTVADGAIQTMKSVAPMSAVEITSFQARKPADLASGNLTTGGKKYNFSSAAEYDNDCLKAYTGTTGNNVNLKDTAYDVYLDNYDNVIGVVEVDKATNYVFITGVDSGNNNLATTTLKANAIFLDGTMKEIEIDRDNSKSFVNAVAAKTSERPANMPQDTGHQNNSTFNQWCTYSVNSKDVYSLSLVAVDGALGAAGQTHTTSGQTEINNKYLSIKNANNVLVYGNNSSVYLSASVDEILTIAGRTDCIIDGVDSVTTGIDNVDITPLYGNEARNAADDSDASAITISEGAYTLYDKNGWIIAMVVIGEDAGKNSDLVYVHNASVAQEYYLGADNGYKWTRTVIIDGVEEELVEVNDVKLSMLLEMDANNWYRVKTNNDGEVTSIDGAQDGAIDDDGDVLNSAKDTIGNWGFTLSSKTAYAKAYADYVTAVRDSGVDTILYHEAFRNMKPSASGQTLYVTTGTDSGVRFAADVKVVLDQKNANKRETEFYSGETGLKNALRDLHENAEGSDKYNYEISAVIEGPYATSIIIRDLVEDGDSGTVTPPTPAAGDIYVDLRVPGTVVVATTRDALDVNDGAEEVLKALEKAGYVFDDSDVTWDGTDLTVVATKTGSKLPITFEWASNNDLTEGGVAVTCDKVPMIIDGGTSTIKYVTGGGTNATQYVKVTDGDTVSYEADNSTTTLDGGEVIESGYYKVVVTGGVTKVDLTKSGMVTPDSGTNYYALKTAKFTVKDTANGTGVKVGTKYFPYGTSFETMGATNGVVTIAAIEQVKFTIYDDSVAGKGAKSEVPVGYNATAADLSSTIDANNKGTMMYVGSRTGTAVVDSTTTKADEDKTFYIGYVKATIDNSSVVWAGKDAAITITWSVANNDVIKNGSKITSTVMIPDAQELTGGGSGNTLTPTATGATVDCDVTGATTDATTGWSSNKFTLDSGKKLKGTIKFTWEVVGTDASATPVLTWA